MDERHWWFASKLQETFHFGGYDNPTLLEDFLSEPEVIELINDFLAPGEPCKLLFYCGEAPTGDSRAPSASRHLHVTAHVGKDIVSHGRVCLYVLRKDLGGEVDVTQMEKELFCGELRHSVLCSLASQLTEAYAPLLHSQRNWGDCSAEIVSSFLQNFTRFSHSLQEATIEARPFHPLLQTPSTELYGELQLYHGKATLLPAELLSECEALVGDWISTIEGLLIETTDERMEDPCGSPLAELGKWRRRQVLLGSLVEQLRSKACRAILGALVATKSRLLKKWKNIDLQITDAFNNARDRMRYLEALSPHLEALTSSPLPSPSTVATSTLPALTATVRQMEGLSRAYARSGYLSILFTKVSSSLVQVCLASLESYVCRNNEDHLWSLISEAITSEAQKSAVEREHPLLARLNSCLTLSTTYKELLHQLRDSLLQQQQQPQQTVSFIGLPNVSTMVAAPSHSSPIGRKPSNFSTTSNLTSKRTPAYKGSGAGNSAGQSLVVNSANTTVPVSPSGANLQDMDKITAGLNDFGVRVSKVLEIVSTLSQFRQLRGSIQGLPRISGLWDLEVTEEGEEMIAEASEGRPASLARDGTPTVGVTSSGHVTLQVSHSPLSALKEESLASSAGSQSQTKEGVASREEPGGKKGKEEATQSAVPLGSGDTSPLPSSSVTSMTSTGLPTTRGVHSDSPLDSLALMVRWSSTRIQRSLELACSGGVSDVFLTMGRRRGMFPSAYEAYATQVATLEENTCRYLRAVFADVASSQGALDITSRFGAVSSRLALRETVRKCMLASFSRYSQELEELQAIYERNKGSPPVSYNAPPVAGAVAWSRELLQRVEQPMETFRSNSAVMQSIESLHICKLHNRLATALLQYENLWLGQWRASIDPTRAGLKAPLLVQEGGASGEGSKVKVNCSDQLLTLIAESKALLRLGVAIPEPARAVLEQESRIKHFKQELEHVLGEFYSVSEAIDPAVQPLLQPHLEAVTRSLLSGWTTLTWSTMNIDAFLHRVGGGVASLASLVSTVRGLLSREVYATLESIQRRSLFDAQFAASTVWHPLQFCNAMVTSVLERSSKLLQDIARIRRAVMEIIRLTSPPSDQAPQTPAKSSGKKSKGSTPARSTCSTSQHSLRSKLQEILSPRSTTASTTPVTRPHSHMTGTTVATAVTMPAAVELSEAAEQVLSHFCELVFDAVSKMVQKSHDQFCAALWGSSKKIQNGAEGSKEQKARGILSRALHGDKKNVSFSEPVFQEVDTSKVEAVSDSDSSHRGSQFRSCSIPPLHLVVEVQFSIPRIHMESGLEAVHSYLAQVSDAIVRVLHRVTWWVGSGGGSGRGLYEVLEGNGTIEGMRENVARAVQVLVPGVEECLGALRLYDFLWVEDLHAFFQCFLEQHPQEEDCIARVEELMQVERKISELPPLYSLGPLQLATEPVKNSLQALAVSWKTKYASFLHARAKTSLDSLVSQREAMRAQLSTSIDSLRPLKETLELLETISDLQHTVDDLYLPVERLYGALRVFNPHLPRSEVQQVDSLRDGWKSLTELAEKVRQQVLVEERLSHEREVDKHIQEFRVESIQFRNSFDNEGPLVPGLVPSDAVSRLGSFLERCEELVAQRDLLGSVQRLLDLPPTPFPELERTETDLSFLRELYANYRRFNTFDKRFRQELWSDVDLDSAIEEVDGFMSCYCSLPQEQQEWEASRNLGGEICRYMDILPVFKMLHSKEVRNRHWLKVMSVAGCTFQLEASVFRMTHLLNANLSEHTNEIEGIVDDAAHELELEEQFYGIEEEWSEQVLQFLPYKSLGAVFLAEDHTDSLLEQLEHAGGRLAVMLASPHIYPLREEVAQWAGRLAAIADVLQQWLSVQGLWHSLEAVFSSPATAREFPEEAVRFTATHSSWLTVMRRAHSTRNVIQCCLGGEVPKAVVLSRMQQELEDCKRSLSSYLLSKRQVFPRFYYVSDDTLLGILSNPHSAHSLMPHLSSLFAAVSNIVTTRGGGKGETPIIIAVESPEGERLDLDSPVPLRNGVERWTASLLSSCQSSLQRELGVATKPGGGASVEECAYQRVTQVASMALFCQWARDCEQALSQCRYDRRAIPSTRTKFSNTTVSKLSSLLLRNSWKVVSEPLTSLHRARLESMATLSVWLRDVLDDLCHRKLRDVSDFEWQRFLRPSLEMGEEHAHLTLKCLDSQLHYGYEYLGCQATPIFTPRANNYVVALTQALSAHLGSIMVGPHAADKTGLVKGIGLLCGRFVSTMHCSPLMDKTTIARAFEGLAQDGSWACFSDVDTLSTSALAILSQMMHTITTALQAKRTTCQLPQGREIVLRPTFAVILTHTPSTLTNAPTWHPSPSLSPLFRSFSLPQPEPTVVFRAYCSALGLRSPRALASKLTLLCSMARDQLSPTCLPPTALCHVLEVATGRLRGGGAGGGASGGGGQTPDHLVGMASSTELQFQAQRGPSWVSSGGRSPNRKPSHLKVSPSHGQCLQVPTQKDHTHIAQLIVTILGPRFGDQELPVFVAMVKDVFGGNPELASQASLIAELSSKNPATSSRTFTQDFAAILPQLKESAQKIGLVPSANWMAKVEQLFTMTTLKHAVVVAGRPATGKTSALTTVVSALNAGSREGCSVKLLRAYPGGFQDMAALFGRVDLTGDWEEGIFTSAFRKASKATQTVTWMCFDGPLRPLWTHYLTELAGRSKTLTLPTGEHMHLNEGSMKLLFETSCLEGVSPALLANSGIIYFDTGVLSWRPVVKAWLSSRKKKEATCLEKLFDAIMDTVVEFVLHKSSSGSTYSEVGLLETCLAYLTTLLNVYGETAEVFSKVHVERLLLFSVIWSYGGVLRGEKDRRKFSYLLKGLTNSLPDDDEASKCSVFDFYVDESGEWDTWQSRLPEQPTPQVDLLGRVFVDTADTIRVEVLLELALSAKRHVLLTGPHGCGKTTVCRHFLHGRALHFTKTETVKQLVFSGHTSATALHDFMQVNFHHRQGYTYGPKHGKSLRLFVDDLHLPLRNSATDDCTAYEYLRQLLDGRGLYNLHKHNEWSTIEDLAVFGALTTSSTSGSSCREEATNASRLWRHLAVVQVPELEEPALRVITSRLLEALLAVGGSEIDPPPGGDPKGISETDTPPSGCLKGILAGSLEAYSTVRQALGTSDLPGRQHYFFSLATLESVFQGLCHLPPSLSPVGGEDGLAFGWSHEMKRAFADGLCRVKDLRWLEGYIDALGRKYLPPPGGSVSPPTAPPLTLSSIPLQKGEEQQRTSVSPLSSLPEVKLHPLTRWSDLHLSVADYLMRYREENGALQLELSDNNLQYLVKLQRALKFPRGNCLLVGPYGQMKEAVSSLALYIAGYPLHPLDTSQPTTFSDGLKALFRQAGLEGKPTAAIINEKALASTEVLKTITSVFACGELPTLFSNDEMDGMLQALTPSIKRDFPSEETDPMQYFTARIYRNLRLVLCVPPTCPLLSTLAPDFKGLLQGCHIVWMRDHHEESLLSTTEHFFTESPLAVQVEERLRPSLYGCLSSIHHLLLRETGQLVQAGLQLGHLAHPPPPHPSAPAPPAPGTDSATSPSRKAMEEPPSSFENLTEKVLQLDREIRGEGWDHALPYVGPRTYFRFLESFCEIFKKKNSEAVAERASLSAALESLDGTHSEVEGLQAALGELRTKHEEAGRLSQSLMAELTTQACQLERTKALLGQGSSVHNAIQVVGEQGRQLGEGEEDEELLAVFMGAGGGKRGSRLEQLVQRAREGVLAAEKEEKATSLSMTKAKEQALHWQSKIDRNTIDQIKSLANPPKLVGIIMELILTLLHQYGTGAEQTGLGISEGSSPGTPGVMGQSSLLRKRSSIAHLSTPGADTARMEKEAWQAIQLAIGDSQRFLDLLAGLKWEDGLSPDAVNLIESRLATSVNQSRGGSTSELASRPSRESVSNSSGSVPSLITVSMARHAAESAAIMCAFAVAIVDYNYSFKPYKLAVVKLQRVRQDLQELESSLEAGSSLPHESRPPALPADLVEELEEEDLQKLEAGLRELQGRFDKAVVEKHSLEQTCQQLSEKLKAANHLLESLKGRQESWQQRLASLPPLEVLVGSCVLAAALTTYCAPLPARGRREVFQSLLATCEAHGLAPTAQRGGVGGRAEGLLSLENYPEYMLGKPSLYHLIMDGLPSDATSQQNACAVCHTPSSSWPLIVDPLRMVEHCLRVREGGATFCKHGSGEVGSRLLQCLAEGSPLVITEVDPTSLLEDRAVADVLQCRRMLQTAKTPIKIVVGEMEMECSPEFKLYLVTYEPVGVVPADLMSLVGVVHFCPDRAGLEGLLLDSFLQAQNPKSAQERAQLREEIYSQAVQVDSLEKELLGRLAQEGAQLGEPKAARAIMAVSKACDDAQESLSRALESHSVMTEVHLATLRSLAIQASVVANVVSAMGSVLPAYRTSYDYMQSVFLAFIEQAGSRIQGEDAADRMMRTAYSHFLRGYFEKDKLLFSLTLSLELELSRGRASRSEWEFLTSPGPGRRFAVKGLSTQVQVDTEGAPIVSFGKKPFDWMSDRQWQMLLMLASHFQWTHDILERLSGKDSKEMVWRMVGEGVAPEFIEFSASIGHKLVPMQQLLLVWAMRPERITFSAVSFITAVLAQRQRKLGYDPGPTDLVRLARGCRPQHLPLILFREDPLLPITKMQQLATKLQVPLTVHCLHGTEEEEELEAVKLCLQEASSQGAWLLLHNAHTCPTLLARLPTLLEAHPPREGWKVWLSASGHAHLPIPLLQSACKVVLDSPKSIRASLLHSLHCLAGDALSCSTRPEWLPLLHNTAMLHATLRLRKETYEHAWTRDYHWTHTHFMDTVSYMMREFHSSELPGASGVRPVSWSGMRHMITEVFYGCAVTDPMDSIVLTALTEHWAHSGGCKREPGRYHIPSHFFTPGTKLSVLTQAVEGASPPLAFTAELCGLYFTPATHLGWEDYLFPTLSVLSTYLSQHTSSAPPTSPTHPQKTSTTNSNILTLSTRPSYPAQPLPPADKLPSFIPIPSQLPDLVSVTSSLLRSLAGKPASLKELPLADTVSKLLENIPTGWKKETLSERLRRHGTDTSYGLFLKSETRRMSECLQGIHTSLQALRSSLLSSSWGDTLPNSAHLVELALCLLKGKIPRCWLTLVGPSAPPGSWPLKEWVQDLVLRYAFLDRILAGGLAKTPTYWLGAFFNPQTFLSIMQQNVIRSSSGKSSVMEHLSFHAELTNRDKDHIRDPPPDGEVFIYGAYVWGCGYEKTTALELHDIPPKSQVPIGLPVLHLRLSPRGDQPSLPMAAGGENKGPFVYHCPCFVSNTGRGLGQRTLFTLTVTNPETTPAKWATRNTAVTLRPF